jgi:hypothetical protein
MINTSIAVVLALILVAATGRPLTMDDHIAIVFLGWVMGWFFRKIFGALIITGDDALQETKKLLNKDEK